jgi:hypothetical protein
MLWTTFENRESSMTDQLEKLGYIHQSDIAFVITKQDVKDIVQSRNGWVDVEWTDELVEKHMKDFEQGLEWSAIDAVHEVVINVAVDIECGIMAEDTE